MENRRVTPDPLTGPGPYLVNLQPKDDLRALLSMGGQAVLDGHFVDPFQMMAQALADDYKSGAITFDAKTGQACAHQRAVSLLRQRKVEFSRRLRLRQTE